MSTHNLNAYRDLTVEEIQTALSYIDAGCVRSEWVEVGMALKAELGNAGFTLFDEWSQTASSYDKTASKDTWKSIRTSGGITIATLIYRAQQSGFALDEDKREPLNQSQIQERKNRQREEAEEADAEFARKRAAAATLANEIWSGLEEVEGRNHPYLERKGVESFGLRVGKWKNYAEPALFIPLRNEVGDLTSLQVIMAKPAFHGRDRDNLKDGQKAGSFHMIGSKPVGESVLVIASGYATAASIHRATGFTSVAVMDDTNLPRVGRVMRKLYKEAQIIIAGDDDRWHKPKDGKPAAPNSGRHYSRQAADAAGGVAILPAFQDATTEPTDFNDLQQLEGFEAVRDQIKRAVPEPDAGDYVPLDADVNPFMFPHLTAQSKPKNTWENLAWMLQEYGITLQYNVITKDLDVKVPGQDYGFDNRANCTLAEITSLCARNNMPKADLALYMQKIANDNSCNPVKDFIDAAPWDGVSRLGQLVDTVKTGPDYDRNLLSLCIRRWLISAVAAALKETDFWSKGVLVFQGGQSKGKTSWIRALLPAPIDNLFKEGAIIDPSQKDTVSSAISHWIVELGELDGTFKKTDVARLKAFISNKVDMLRRPYDRLESKYPRRTVFFASVNPKEFLSDDTGNVRWWTVPVTDVNYEHGIDAQQIWAEVAVLFREGERWWMNDDEEALLELTNAEHTPIDPLEELIRGRFNWAAPLRPRTMSATDVLIAIGYDKPGRAAATQASTLLKKITGKEPRKSNGSKVFDMPPSINEKPF